MVYENKKLFLINENDYRELSINELIDMYSPLVKKSANSYKVNSFEFDDLFQEANISVCKAYASYDIKANVSIGKYLTVCIKNALNNYVMSSKNKVLVNSSYSLDYNYNNNENRDCSLYNLIGEDKCENIDMFINQTYVNELLLSLSNRERFVLENVFLYNNTQQYIATKLNITQAHVSRLKTKGLQKLKQLAI